MKGEEPVGSMGIDTPLACLSDKPQSLFSYFKQTFAQVTNPAIDPIREDMVMSLNTYIGREGNILDEAPKNAHTLKLRHPIISNWRLEKLRSVKWGDFLATTLVDALFRVDGGDKQLEKAVDEALCEAGSSEAIKVRLHAVDSFRPRCRSGTCADPEPAGAVGGAQPFDSRKNS